MSLIVYIFSVFFPCRRNSSVLRVRSAGHALNLNKGCTKRQSLPNCKQLPKTRRPGFRGYKSRDPDRTAAERGAAGRATDNKRQALDDGRRNGRRTTSGERWTMNGKTRNDRRKTRRNTDEGGRPDKAGEMRAEGDTDREKHGQWEMRAGKRKTEDGKKDGAKSDAAKTDRTAESAGKKKQACATAGPTTRPEGRHTIFISARPEYASQRRESSYRPA